MSILNEFGKDFIKNVRDESIDVCELKLNGKIKAEQFKEITDKVISMNNVDANLVKDMIPTIVDETLHYLLWFFETNEKYSIIDNNSNNRIDELSDGLAGELYTEDGWIQQFSLKNSKKS